jgi:hypothetical protein
VHSDSGCTLFALVVAPHARRHQRISLHATHATSRQTAATTTRLEARWHYIRRPDQQVFHEAIIGKSKSL